MAQSTRRARNAKPPAKADPEEQTRQRILDWWATVGGILSELYEHVGLLLESPHVDMFCPFNLKELRSSLGDAACEWGAAGPTRPTNLFPDIAALLEDK